MSDPSKSTKMATIRHEIFLRITVAASEYSVLVQIIVNIDSKLFVTLVNLVTLVWNVSGMF